MKLKIGDKFNQLYHDGYLVITDVTKYFYIVEKVYNNYKIEQLKIPYDIFNNDVVIGKYYNIVRI